MKKYCILLWMLILASFSQAQEKKLVQFSGVILHSDSLVPLPYVNVINITRGHRGTYTDFKGFFSLVVNEGDTIRISSLGYKKEEIVIPENGGPNLSKIFKLQTDNINIPIIYIFPWPTIEQFKQAFIKLRLPDDDLAIAYRNLDAKVMSQMVMSMPMDGSMNTRYYFQQQSEKLYWAGQNRPNPLLDIVKLNQFMQLLNQGKISFRNEKREE